MTDQTPDDVFADWLAGRLPGHYLREVEGQPVDPTNPPSFDSYLKAALHPDPIQAATEIQE